MKKFLLSLILILIVFSWNISEHWIYVAEIKPVEAAEIVEIKEVDIKERVQYFASNYGSSTLKLAMAIAEAESDFQNTCNTEGCRYGIGVFQIVQSTFDENCIGSPYDINDNIKCALKMIDNQEYWRWKESADEWLSIIDPMYIPYECSCIKTVRKFGIDLPLRTNAEDLKPNTTPGIGKLVLFRYAKFSHVALITEISPKGFWVTEGNFKRCRETKRFVYWIDPFMIGFTSIESTL